MPIQWKKIIIAELSLIADFCSMENQGSKVDSLSQGSAAVSMVRQVPLDC